MHLLDFQNTEIQRRKENKKWAICPCPVVPAKILEIKGSYILHNYIKQLKIQIQTNDIKEKEKPPFSPCLLSLLKGLYYLWLSKIYILIFILYV